MNYQETLEYLYKSTPVFQHIGGAAYKEGLENSLSFDSHLNHPHKSYHTIHVGGTNGKGSTSHLLAAILQQSGYKIGLYTSPHLRDFKERIRVNGEKINEQFIIDFIQKHKDFIETLRPSFFETTMSMAFDYFAHEKVDVSVIEVGLGGRLDSTNIIHPDLCVITNISFDHTQFLGDTLVKIAHEKAGIIKTGIPVVIGEAQGDVRTAFEEKARSVSSPIIFAEDEKIVEKAEILPNGKFLFQTKDYPDLIGELGGLVQEKNATTVLCAIRELEKAGFSITKEAVYDGFAHVIEITGLEGRWQVISNAPKIILDTGHNTGGISYVVRQLEQEKYEKLHFIIGMVNDKDITGVLKLLPKYAIYYFTKASIPRALDEIELSNRATAEGLSGKTFPSVEEAIKAAKVSASPDDLIFIGGSNFIVADALTCMFGI